MVCGAPQVVLHQNDVPGIDFRIIAISVLIYLGSRECADAWCAGWAAGGVAPGRCARQRLQDHRHQRAHLPWAPVSMLMQGVLGGPQVVSRQDNVPGIDFKTIAISVLIYLGSKECADAWCAG